MKKKKVHTDLSKVDISNDFRDFPQLYSTPDDIEKFIAEHKVDVPVLSNLLRMRKANELELTPTESVFYFDSLFDYIYDVYRVPVPETYKNMDNWLHYIELNLIHQGFRGVMEKSYEDAVQAYHQRLEIKKIFDEMKVKRELPKIINCHQDVEAKYPMYYNRSDTLESFWIKSSMYAGQPVRVGDEAYMRVHVYANRVYIVGCDDCSYTVFSDDQKELSDFVLLLKSAAPVWNFAYCSIIHPKLEFTN